MKFHIKKNAVLNDFLNNSKSESVKIIDEFKNESGDAYVTVDFNSTNQIIEDSQSFIAFQNELHETFDMIALNDDLSLKYPEKDMPFYVYTKIIDIVSSETKLSVLKNKRNNFMKLKDKIENQMTSANNAAVRFGAYDDCGPSYIAEEKEADARHKLMKEMEEFLPANEVIEQSKIVGSLKYDFKTKHPEFYHTMFSVLEKSQKNRESITQNNLKRRKVIYKSAANIAMALDGFLDEAKKNKVKLDRAFKDRVAQVSSTTMLTFNKRDNPVKELPEHFRLHPDRVPQLVSLAKDAINFDMKKERKKLISSLVERIEKAQNNYLKG